MAVYQTHASPFYFARVDPRTQHYKVRSTKETSRVEARKVAEHYAQEITRRDAPADKEFSFRTYAKRFSQKGQHDSRSPGSATRTTSAPAVYSSTTTPGAWCITSDGVMSREITTRDWQLFIENIIASARILSSSTRNMLMATFRNVLKVARDDGLIDFVSERHHVCVRRTIPARSSASLPRLRRSRRRQLLREQNWLLMALKYVEFQ